MAVQPNIGDVKLTDAAISAQQTIVPRQPTSYDPIAEQIGQAADFFRQKQVQEVVTYSTEKGKAEGAKLAAEQRRVAEGAAFPREEAGKFVGYDRVLSKEQSAPISAETYGFNPLSSGYDSFKEAYRKASAVNIAVQAKAEMDRVAARVMVDQRVSGPQKLAILRDYGTQIRDQYSKSLEGVDPNLQNAINASLDDQLVSSFVQASDDIAKADIEQVRVETVSSINAMRHRLADEVANPNTTKEAFMRNMFLLGNTIKAAYETGAIDGDTSVKLYSGPGNLMDTLAQNYVDVQAIKHLSNNDIESYNRLADEVNSGGFFIEGDERYGKGKVGFKYNITMKKFDALGGDGAKKYGTKIPVDVVSFAIENGISLFDPVDLDKFRRKVAVSRNMADAYILGKARQFAAEKGRQPTLMDLLDGFEDPNAQSIIDDASIEAQAPVAASIKDITKPDAEGSLYDRVDAMLKTTAFDVGANTPAGKAFKEANDMYQTVRKDIGASDGNLGSKRLYNGKPNAITSTFGVGVEVADPLEFAAFGGGSVEQVGKLISDQTDLGYTLSGRNAVESLPLPAIGDVVAFSDSTIKRAKLSQGKYGHTIWTAGRTLFSSIVAAGGHAYAAAENLNANETAFEIKSEPTDELLATVALQSAFMSASPDDPSPNTFFQNQDTPESTVSTLLDRWSAAKEGMTDESKDEYRDALSAARKAVTGYVTQTGTSLQSVVREKMAEILAFGMLTKSEDGKTFKFNKGDQNNQSILTNLAGKPGTFSDEKRWGGRRTLIEGKADYMGPGTQYETAKAAASRYIEKTGNTLQPNQYVTVLARGKDVWVTIATASANGLTKPIFIERVGASLPESK